VNNAEPYVYNDTVDEKLVLPDKVKMFMTALIAHSKAKFEDIVGGKEGGTIILIEGGPGLGKTLSAEVYSEKMHRPLYKVQSSQLGIDVKTIEENLKKVLQRSERWGAILLIDEADVYIRARGENIQQNAIVGVFLRVLEYYRGVLFMTTNLGHTVDEAIESRVMARFKFKNPCIEDQKKLWRILSDQNKAGLDDKEIERIVNMRGNLTGRDIKNILKLSMVMASNAQKTVDCEMIKFVSEFKQSE
jgi:SpoVK/Ycf46/Vps4 family AAA+-type ATPase